MRQIVKITLSILFLLLVVLIYDASRIQVCAEEAEFFTVQTGIFSSLDIANRNYNQLKTTLTKNLKKDQSVKVRIEKSGPYYAVRLGTFSSRNVASKYRKILGSSWPDAVIVKDYYLTMRVISLERVSGAHARSARSNIVPLTGQHEYTNGHSSEEGSGNNSFDTILSAEPRMPAAVDYYLIALLIVLTMLSYYLSVKCRENLKRA